jgi:hypothetical protein
VRGVDVGVAQAGGLDPDDDLACAGDRLRHLLDLRRLSEGVDNGCTHRLRTDLPAGDGLES